MQGGIGGGCNRAQSYFKQPAIWQRPAASRSCRFIGGSLTRNVLTQLRAGRPGNRDSIPYNGRNYSVLYIVFWGTPKLLWTLRRELPPPPQANLQQHTWNPKILNGCTFLNVTFMGPCIANIFAEYNQQDATFLSLFISVRRSTCFRRFFRPSSGAQNCTYSVRHLSDRYCYLLLVWPG